jgi:hypothetical protein
VAAVLLSATVVASLTACGTREAGAAAVIGDRRISVAEVQDAYRDLVPLIGPDQQLTQSDVLNWLILEPYLVRAAGRAGRGVSDQDARLQFTDGGPAEPSAAGIRVVRANLASSQLQSDNSAGQVRQTFEGIGRQLRSTGVRINPRYGAAMDYSTFTISPEQPNWLVKAPASAAATPVP